MHGVHGLLDRAEELLVVVVAARRVFAAADERPASGEVPVDGGE